jgi:hypothetical protein
MIKEKALTLKDLDRIWEAQSGKHEAIVKNVHDLLAKLAWDFSPEQLDHLFECFQVSRARPNAKMPVFNYSVFVLDTNCICCTRVVIILNMLISGSQKTSWNLFWQIQFPVTS